MTTPVPGTAGLDELRRADRASEDDNWPGHWRAVGCYCVSVEVAGVPYVMLNLNGFESQYGEQLHEDVDPDADSWMFFNSIEEADDFVKVEAVKKRISE
jgi:hypothetical protein